MGSYQARVLSFLKDRTTSKAECLSWTRVVIVWWVEVVLHGRSCLPCHQRRIILRLATLARLSLYELKLVKTEYRVSRGRGSIIIIPRVRKPPFLSVFIHFTNTVAETPHLCPALHHVHFKFFAATMVSCALFSYVVGSRKTAY